jgi:hypothetical protein
MSKNIFDETASSKRMNAFESLKFSSKNLLEDSNKNGRRMIQTALPEQPEPPIKISESVFNEEHEIKSSKPKAKFKTSSIIHYPRSVSSTTQSSGSSPPAMYKIALRLKRLTEGKLKKTQSETAALSTKDFKEDLSVSRDIIITRDIIDNNITNQNEISETNDIVDFDLDVDKNLADSGESLSLYFFIFH